MVMMMRIGAKMLMREGGSDKDEDDNGKLGIWVS